MKFLERKLGIFSVVSTLLSLTVFSAGKVHAGRGVGNGGDLIRDQENIWFLGDAPVEYCIQSSPDFGLNASELSGLVREVISDWLKFLSKYKIDQTVIGGSSSGPLMDVQFPDGKPRGITTQFLEIPKCLADQEQIEFHFGNIPAELKESLEQRPFEIGVATRGAYNHQTHRNGGYVWLAEKIEGKSWRTQASSLKHLLLHEVGHVFGMRHNSTHVMSEFIADMVVGVARGAVHPDTPIWFGWIESPAWPYDIRIDDAFINEARNGKKRCTDVIALPNELRLALKLPEQECVEEHLRFDPKTQTINLEFVDQKGKVTKMEGLDTLSRFPFLSGGPSVYSNFVVQSPGGTSRTVSTFVEMDPIAKLQLQGGLVFRFGGKKFPALILSRHGYSLQIYLSDLGQWKFIN